MAAKMQAALFTATSDDPKNLKLTEVDVPEPSPGSVVVQVKAAAVNPVDAMVMSGAVAGFGWAIPLPFTMGSDFAGVVSAVHPDDAEAAFKVGDAVFAVNWGSHRHDDDASTPGGAFAQYIKIPVAKLSKKPAGISFQQAAGVALVGTTARQIVLKCAKVEAGQRVLIFGGATAVGSLAVQLAKNQGAWVATTASPRTAEYVAQFGADKIVDYTSEKWEEDKDLKGLDAVIDTVAEADALSKMQEHKTIKEDGRFVTIANHGMGFDPTANPPLQFASSMFLENSVEDQDALAAGLADGSLKLTIDTEFPFTDEGLYGLQTACKGGKAKGKLILNVAA